MCTTGNLVPKRPVLTVGEHFDEQIEKARKHVEELCVKKAKLEAMNLLKHPYEQLTTLLQAYTF